MTKNLILIACIFGVSAVVLGAFGAHILGKILTEADLKTFQTGVDYQFYHTFAILCAALLSRYTNKKWINIAGWLFTIGIILFSGSLYLLSVSYAFEMEALKPVLGPLTPLGGILFIGGWLALLLAGTQYKVRSRNSHSRSSSKE